MKKIQFFNSQIDKEHRFFQRRLSYEVLQRAKRTKSHSTKTQQWINTRINKNRKKAIYRFSTHLHWRLRQQKYYFWRKLNEAFPWQVLNIINKHGDFCLTFSKIIVLRKKHCRIQKRIRGISLLLDDRKGYGKHGNQ